jgi:hypothetical protein
MGELSMKSALFCALALFGAGSAWAQPKVHSFTYDGSVVYGVNELPDVQLVGTYVYEGKKEPRVELRADGTGCWANHSRPCKTIRWWIQADANGKPLGQYGAGGSVHTLLFENIEAPSEGSVGPYDGFQLVVDKVERKVIIAGEREKGF